MRWIILIAGGLAAACAVGWYVPEVRSRVAPLIGVGDAGVCGKHGLPAAECPFCDPSLAEKMGTCGEHGVPEALCWRCNKKLVAVYQKMGDWCREHAAPESLCSICRGPGGHAHADDDGHGRGHDADDYAGHSHAVGGDEHAYDGAKMPASSAANGDSAGNSLRNGDDIPRPQRAPAPECTKAQSLVRLASNDAAARAGFRTVRLARRPVTRSIVCTAEIVYDQRRFARLAARVPGVVREVKHDLGDHVELGEVLVIVDSAELATAKADLLQSRENESFWAKRLERDRELDVEKLIPIRELHETEMRANEGRIAVARARQRLASLGLTASEIEQLEANRDTSPLLPLMASFAGTIVERNAVVGELVELTRPLLAIADTTRMWAMLDVAGADAGLLRVGQPVGFEDDAAIAPLRSGRISWISTAFDDRTRTLRARVDLENGDGLLRANMFGRATIDVLANQELLVVPKNAVQWDGCCNVVFVRESDTEYRPHKVRLGIEVAEGYEVRDGLAVGDAVVTQGSFLLKTEIMKGEIGAGCCPGD